MSIQERLSDTNFSAERKARIEQRRINREQKRSTTIVGIPERPNDENYLNLIALHKAEIPKRTFLTAAQERVLSEQIQSNTKRLNEIPTGTPEYTTTYNELILGINSLMEYNYPLVIKLARNYMNRGVPILDLVQEGYLGLRRAAESFDPDKGRFTTYASLWVRNKMESVLQETAQDMKIPDHRYQTVGRYRRTKRLLSERLEREPSKIELAEEMNISLSKLDKILKDDRPILLLNKKVGENNTEFGEFVPDSNQDVPSIAQHTVVREDLDLALSILTERERDVLVLRSGFSGKKYTLQEIGEKYGLTRERIRMIEKAAINKILTSEKAPSLREFYLPE